MTVPLNQFVDELNLVILYLAERHPSMLQDMLAAQPIEVLAKLNPKFLAAVYKNKGQILQQKSQLPIPSQQKYIQNLKILMNANLKGKRVPTNINNAKIFARLIGILSPEEGKKARQALLEKIRVKA